MKSEHEILPLARVAIAVFVGYYVCSRGVNPASAGWVWMRSVTLIKGMRTFDTVQNRGYILVQPR